MRRRPSRMTLWLAFLGIALAAVLLGISGLGEAARIVGGVFALNAAKDWCVYWAARERFEAWRKRPKTVRRPDRSGRRAPDSRTRSRAGRGDRLPHRAGA